MSLANDDIQFVSNRSTPAFTKPITIRASFPKTPTILPRATLSINTLASKSKLVLLCAAFDNRLPACFQFKVSEQPYTVSSIRPGRRGGSRTHSPRGNGFTVRRDSPTSPPSEISDHQSLSTLVPCYLVVWVGDIFEFLSPSEPLKLYEGVV